MKKMLALMLAISIVQCGLIVGQIFGGGTFFAEALAETEIDAESIYSTGHFSFNAPSGWLNREKDGWHYFYAKELGNLSGGILCVQENYLGLVSDSDIQALYDSCGNGIQQGKTYVDGYKSEQIIVDGEPSALFEYRTNISGEPVQTATVQYYINGYAITMSLADRDAENLKGRVLDVAKTVKYSFDKHPMTHNFGRKFFQIIGHKVINQYGRDCLVVEYRWFHTNNEPTAFMYSFSTEAYQDGVQLQSYILMDGDSEMMTKIEKSTFMRCYDVFLLRNTSSDVKVLIDERFDFSNKYKAVEYIADLNN